MEKREDYLRRAKEILESGGVSVDDFVQYCAEKETVKAEGIVQRFAFEVMYEGMVRSWVPLEGKKPLGVIVENRLISLHDFSRTVPWKEAVRYCQSVKIEGHACSAGEIGFWKRLLRLSEQQKKMLDDLLVSLGGMALVGKWFWSSSEYDYDKAWVFCTGTGARRCGVSYRDKNLYHSKYIARPVLDLAELFYAVRALR